MPVEHAIQAYFIFASKVLINYSVFEQMFPKSYKKISQKHRESADEE